MDISTEEAIFIAYREDIKTFYNKWEKIFNTIGYKNVPIAVANTSIRIEDAFKLVDYKIKWEQENSKVTLFNKIKEMNIDEFTEWLQEFSLEYVLNEDTIKHQLEQ